MYELISEFRFLASKRGVRNAQNGDILETMLEWMYIYTANLTFEGLTLEQVREKERKMGVHIPRRRPPSWSRWPY
jgi:hypothetical protein